MSNPHKGHSNIFICKFCKKQVSINRNTLRLGANIYTHHECTLGGKEKFNVTNNDISILLPQNISSSLWQQPIEIYMVRPVILSKFEFFIFTTDVNFGGRKKSEEYYEEINSRNQAILFEGVIAFLEISKKIYIDPKKEFQKFRKKYFEKPRFLEKLYWLSTITNQQIDFSIPIKKTAEVMTNQKQYLYN